ncbi:MAG TPA: aminopeptidase P family protein [Burkholderiaceae bacterium]|nr:aminopeptidase P family protein [Burkholderiaceae bacterium]
MDTVVDSVGQVRARIDALRASMSAHGLSTWIALSSDPHLSEYLPARWQSRQWLSGFSGSAGTLVLTADFAGLWVDSRYWVEAEAQLAGSGIQIVRASSAVGTALFDWLAQNVASNSEVGTDGQALGLSVARSIEAALAKRGARLRTDLDLLDEIWTARPALPLAAVCERRRTLETLDRREKIATVRQQMAVLGAQWHWISSLDDIAWLLNLRGADVPFNPVFLAHVLIGPSEVRLFVAPEKVAPPLREQLLSDGVSIVDYAQARAALGALAAGDVLLIDPRRVTLATVRSVPAGVRIIEQTNPTVLLKARKSDAELANVRLTMEQDGAALCEFFAWLEQALDRCERVTELSIDEQVTAQRARRQGFVSPSFGTIAAFNANAAAPHYSASAASHAVICEPAGHGNGLLLIDSGGQYETGTTDITRVVAIGEPTDEQRRDFTLVLKGMIQLSRAHFPRGTRSPMLDALARAPIWAAGIDYGHGTGHGVGYFLNVHEGPQSISPHLAPDPQTAMEPGMITSNEPGIYRPGRWGVRIENLLATVPSVAGEFGEFLKFETLTLCPIDTRCIDRSLLRDDEVAWLNDYHRQVRERLTPLVSAAALAWLDRSTQPL